MDHILQVGAEEQSSLRLCDGGVARFTRSVDTSRATMALAAIAFVALFLSSSPFSVAGSGSPSSPTLSARLLAVGSIFTSKTVLFLLSNVIFVLLAADYRCGFTTASSASSVEPCGVLEKQARHHHQVHVDQCAGLSSVPCSQSLDDHNEQEGKDRSTMSATANTLPDEEQPSELELMARLGEEEDSSSTLEETVDVEEPTCKTAQGLDGLEISELNKKFDEFIRSRRIKWVKEEAYLLLYEV